MLRLEGVDRLGMIVRGRKLGLGGGPLRLIPDFLGG